ncbi:Bifunctional apoptosis regulator [Lamellibrachia satsuma]|nr:Bifunctional apoptosis regulator [Lamellibrachia satsuma]
MEQLPESLFMCSCCRDTMVEPTTLMCGHSFCRPCVAQWYLKSGKRECPNCRQVDERVPNVNTVLRSTIMNVFNGEYDKRLKELSSDICAMQNIAKFEKLPTLPVTDKLFTLLRNRVAFVKGVVWSLSCLISPTSMAQKPVVKWNPEKTCQWLKELGQWTEEGLVPYFRDQSIDGHLLMALQESDLDGLRNSTTSLQMRAFIEAVYSVRTHSFKPPHDLWEYKALNFGKTLLYAYGLRRNVRTTLLLMCLFDYTDSFLPFIHVTVPVLGNITVVDLNTFQFQTPSVGQWVEFTALWLGLPYVLVGEFILARFMMVNWWTSLVQLAACAALTYFDYSQLQPGLG